MSYLRFLSTPFPPIESASAEGFYLGSDFFPPPLPVADSWWWSLAPFFVYFLIVMLNREDDMLGMLVTVLFPAGMWLGG